MTDEQLVELLTFLQDWLAWVERSAPNNRPYSRTRRLCLNTAQSPIKSIPERLRKDGLCLGYPFGILDYYLQRHMGTQHECPQRLAWVRKTIEELENETK